MLQWPVIIGSLLVLLSLPGTLELAVLTLAGLLPKRVRQANSARIIIRKIAVIIPAHNEAAVIARCVKSVAACLQPEGAETETVVVADNCSDATPDIARDGNARVMIRSDLEKRGKGFALRFAFKRLVEEGFHAFLVVDADSVVDSNFLVEVVRLLRSGADAVQTRYAVLNYDASLRTRFMNIALMAFNILRARARDRMSISVGIFGNGFALSSTTLKAVPYEAFSLVEDLEYHLRIVESGRQVVFADRTEVRADMPASRRGASSQRARWEGGRLRVAIQCIPRLLKSLARGDLRLLEPLMELLLLPLAFQAAILGAAIAIPFEPTRIYGLCALVVMAIHVVGAVIIGGGDWKDLMTLLIAPVYVAWKIAVAPLILRAARTGTPWVRTAR